ncbi:XerC Integrase [Caulobacteraceae bacterium]
MPKRSAPLAANFLKTVKYMSGGKNEYPDGNNLYLRVIATGNWTWVLKMRCSGTMGTFTVGDNFGLKEAREAAAALRVKIKSGYNPNEEKQIVRQRQKSAKLGIGTFEAIVDEYFEVGNGAENRTKREQRKRIKSVFVRYLKKPGHELVMAKLQISADSHPAKTSAARAVAYLNPILKWAARRDLTPKGIQLEKPYTMASEDKAYGQRYLSDEEVKALLPNLNDGYGRCARFMLLTAARMSEATEATWEEFDLEGRIWTIPAKRRKDTRSKIRKRQVPNEPFEIPLSEQAVALLHEVKTLELQRRDVMQIEEQLTTTTRVFNGNRGGKLVNWDRWLKLVSPKANVFNWSAHAFRRTAATMAGNLGAWPEIQSVVLGHKNIGGQLLAGYSKSKYFNQHKKALKALGKKIENLK